MDINKDGQISMEELEQNIDKLHLYELTAASDLNKDQESNPAKQIMMMCDQDGDQNISFEEFV